jgi:hypothetical protein
MASGRPTVVSKGAGAAELVEHGSTGFHFEKDNPESLAVAIDLVLRKPPSRLRDLTTAARAVVEEHLNPRTIALERYRAYQAAALEYRSKPQQPRAEDWLRDACVPSKRYLEPAAFLDQHSLGMLTRHTISRLRLKAKQRLTGLS